MRHSTHSRRNFLVRLACVKHAASVQSEPESNSPVEKSSSCTQASRPESVELKALFPIRSSLVKEPPAAVQQRREAFMHPSASPVKHFFRLFQNIFRYAPLSPFLTVCYNIVFFAARKPAPAANCSEGHSLCPSLFCPGAHHKKTGMLHGVKTRISPERGTSLRRPDETKLFRFDKKSFMEL